MKLDVEKFKIMGNNFPKNLNVEFNKTYFYKIRGITFLSFSILFCAFSFIKL